MDPIGQWTRFAGGVACVGLLLLSAGCVVGPDYEPPEPRLPESWQEYGTNWFVPGPAQLQQWWYALEDPLLVALVERASLGNLDLKVAAARVQEARAAQQVVGAQYAPNLNAGGTVMATRSSESTTPLLPPGVGREDGYFALGLDAAWEADLWGRIRRSVESAEAGWEATIEDYHDLSVILYAEIALTYIDVRTIQEQLELVLRNIDLQRETLELARARFNAELVPELDVQQAELNLATTESTLPLLQESLALAVNRLGVLLGEFPGQLVSELQNPSPIPAPAETVAVGLPANLLRQRPDVRRAERVLAAQTARIGIAQSELYPRLILVGNLSLEALDAGSLFNAGSTTYGFGPQLRWNLFTGGRIRASIRIEEARTEQALLAYEQTVLLALEETENAMVSLARRRDRDGTLVRAVAAAEKSAELVLALYRSGLTDFQNVLNTQRLLTEQHNELAANQGIRAKNLVRLYKALGGGWGPTQVAVAPDNPMP